VALPQQKIRWWSLVAPTPSDEVQSMSAEHFALYMGALCVMIVIVGVAVIVARPELISEGAATSSKKAAQKTG
jgi:hypothetical protein